MLRKTLIFGLAAGLLAGLPVSIVALTFKGPQAHGVGGMIFGYLVMLAALSLVFIAVKRHRDGEGGGVIGFLPALGLGLGVSLVAGLIYAVCWETALAIGHIDFATAYAREQIEARRAAGASAQEIARVSAEMAAFQAQYANPVFRLGMTFLEIFPVGVLASVVSAALLRNRRFLPAGRA